MLKYLLLKDIKLLIRDLRFQIFFIIVISLFIVGTLKSINQFPKLKDEYNNNYSELIGDAKENSKFLVKLINCRLHYLQPISNSLFIHCNNKVSNNFSSSISIFEINNLSRLKSREGFKINWYFIIGIILSFAALIFSYDSISDEKEKGNLRLLTSYGSSRVIIVISKLLSLVLVFGIIIGVSFLLSILFWFLSTGSLTVNLFTNIMIYYIISMIYVSIFLLIGLLISMSKNSYSNIVKVLFVWILFTIIVPKFSAILVNKFHKVPLRKSYLERMSKAYDDEYSLWCEKYDDHETNLNYVCSNNYLEKGLRMQAFNSALRKHNAVYMEWLNAAIKNSEIIEKIQQISPYGILMRISDVLFDEGLYRFSKEIKNFETHHKLVKTTIISEDLKDESSMHHFYSQAVTDGKNVFSAKEFSKPELLILTKYKFDNLTTKLQIISMQCFLLFLYVCIIFMVIIFKIKNLDIR